MGKAKNKSKNKAKNNNNYKKNNKHKKSTNEVNNNNKKNNKEQKLSEQYKIEIQLLSETIFGSGESVSNSVDMEVLNDNYGIPYMRGKTFKGKLRVEVESIASYLSDFSKEDYMKYAHGMFGIEGRRGYDSSHILETLKFSDCTISKNIKMLIENEVEQGSITKEDIKDALTEVRSFTSIDDKGIAINNSLRQARVVKKDLTYYVDINIGRKLECVEEGLLAAGVYSLRNIGAMESRGKGRVQCKLYKNDEDVTLAFIKKLKEKVG